MIINKKILLLVTVFGLRAGMLNSHSNLSIQAIILAAGKSTRFHTSDTKLSYPLCGQEMIIHPIKLLSDLDIMTTLVLGHKKEGILDIIKKHNMNLSDKLNYVEQQELKGTGHAILCTKAVWREDKILILNGDMPLVNKNIIEELINTHQKTDAAISLVVTKTDDPRASGYGRLVNKDNKLEIVEAKDFRSYMNADPKNYTCLNAGIYLINKKFLEEMMPTLTPSLITGEIYITDLIKKASQNNLIVNTVEADFDIVRGINTLQELWDAEKIKQSEIISYWMSKGVYFEDPSTVRIDSQVMLDQDSKISAFVQLLGNVKIGTNCLIGPFSIINDTVIEKDSVIKSHSVISNSIINEAVQVGPFAHIQNSEIGQQAILGNFVETNRSSIGSSSKAKHLTYLGDAEIGSHVNIGAGTITCNYNGVTKSKTIINDRAFIGSNSSLIAPLSIGEEALIGAGSVITEDVPKEALAITRADQVIKNNYVPKLKARYALKK